MHIRRLMLAGVLGIAVLGSVAHAASPDEYQTVRAKNPDVAVLTGDSLMETLKSKAGQVVEIDGTVGGILSSADKPGFLLQVSPSHMITIVTAGKDADVTVGRKVRVLARVPNTGGAIEGLTLMRTDADATRLAQSAPSTTAQPTQAPAAAKAAEENTKPAEKDVTMELAVADPPAPPAAPTAQATKRVQAATMPTRGKLPSRSATKRVRKAAPKKVTVAAKPTPKPKPAAKPAKTAVPQNVAWYASKIRQHNRGVSAATATKIATNIIAKSKKYGVDPRLTLSLIAQESGFRTTAVSPMGAKGLGQLMPGTAAQMGISNPFDIAQNIEGTVRYFAAQLRKFGGNLAHALAAYNAGPGNVSRYRGIPPFRETIQYVRNISSRYNSLIN